jgi:mono/diheme cytochrome c family protein
VPQEISVSPVLDIFARSCNLRNDRRVSWAKLALPVLIVVVAIAGTGCERDDMHNQPRAEAGEASDFFADGIASRPQPAGTVPIGALPIENPHLYTGRINGEPATTFPFAVTRTDLERGRERYNIYCSVCHGTTGAGDGMIVQRGFVKPPSLLEPRLRQAAPGHFFHVVTNGWGAMYSYDDRIGVEDRWRIAAYVGVLQLAQPAELAALPELDREKVRTARPLEDLIRDVEKGKLLPTGVPAPTAAGAHGGGSGAGREGGHE